MGHDEHFLSRLDRVTPPEVELALTLYRDHKLVSWILHRARVPEAVDRIAIALTRDDAPAHVIVARNGHFVTCLGRGMSVGDRIVITRGRLDALMGEFTALSARTEELAERHVSPIHLLAQLINGGNRFSREEFETIAPLEPLIRAFAVAELAHLQHTQARVRPSVLEALRRRCFRGVGEDLLRSYWGVAHGIANLTVLVGMAGPEAEHVITDCNLPRGYLNELIATGAELNSLSFMTRGAWAMGRFGWNGFKACRSSYSTAMDAHTLVQCWGGLMAHAHATPWRTDDILASFDAHREARLDGRLGELHDIRVVLERVGRAWLLAPTQHAAEVQASLLRGLGGRKFEAGMEASIARAVCANLPTSFAQAVKHRDSLEAFARNVAFIAGSSPADLFLPRRLIEPLLPAWAPSATATLVALHAPVTRTPARVTERPGRNDLCSCRSGLKYKRCCALRAPLPYAVAV